MSEWNGLNPKYASQFMAIARKNPKDPAALDALWFVLRRVRGGKDVDEAFDVLQEHYLNSRKLDEICQAVMHSISEKANPFLKALLQKNEHKPTRAYACFALAVSRKLRGEQGGGEKVVAESVKLYQRVVDEFADVRDRFGPLGAQSEEELAEINGPRGIGKVAPEIEGEDLGGVRFKLSDYRGKVVLLDFWGNG